MWWSISWYVCSSYWTCLIHIMPFLHIPMPLIGAYRGDLNQWGCCVNSTDCHEFVRRWAQTPSHISENMIKTWSKCQSVYSNRCSKPQQEPLESIILAKVIITLHPQMFTPKCLQAFLCTLGKIGSRISWIFPRNGCTFDGWDPCSCDLLVMPGMFG